MSRNQMSTTNRLSWWGALAAAGAGLVILGGCTGHGSANSAGAAHYPVAPEDSTVAATTAAVAPNDGTAKKVAGTVTDIAAAPDGRQVIRTASVTVQISQTRTQDHDADDAALTAAVSEAAVKVRALVGVAGYVSSSESSGSVATISLRIPAASYESVMSALTRVGTITTRQEQAQDVSAQLVDVGSRILTMRASVTRVRALLTQAERIADVVALESELQQREADLDSLLRQQSALSGQVALSTITVLVQGRLTGVPAGSTDPRQQAGFLAGLQQGWSAVTDFLGGLAQVVGALLPFLPLVGVVGLCLFLLVRRARRRAVPGAATTVQSAAATSA